MRNYKQDGAVITLTAPYGVASGGVVKVGSIIAVATGNVAEAAEGEFCTAGVFDLTKANGAVTQGARVYWNDTDKVVTTTASGNTLIGVAILPAAAGDATVRVRLNGSF
ncbi:MAG: DUF2190 family protein [Sphingobium sp.]|nr:DUF2190 family protein [Sphingobium sp.]